jgi:hypothetical protein
MVNIEQPDGSEYQFLLIDPWQASAPRDPGTIGANQDPAKRARYDGHLRTAYRVANEAVQRIIEAVGTSGQGDPDSDVIVVSDHGFSVCPADTRRAARSSYATRTSVAATGPTTRKTGTDAHRGPPPTLIPERPECLSRARPRDPGVGLHGTQEVRGANLATERGQPFTQEAERDVPHQVGAPAVYLGQPPLQ